jgi:hypothetical protein
VDRGGEVVYAQPHSAIGMRMYCFVVDVDTARVDKKAQREFNAPTGNLERFASATPAALLNFVTISCITPAEPPDSWLGYLPEHECSLWVPVVDLKRRQLLWSVPYMFVDSGPAMSGGREIFGFPKQYGWLDVPRTDNAPDTLTLETVALEHTGPDEQAEKRLLVKVTRPGGAEAVPLTSTANIGPLIEKLLEREAFAELKQLGHASLIHKLVELRDPALLQSAPATALLFLGQILEMKLPMVLLKQFRDIADPQSACYAGVVRVTNEISHFRGGGLLPDDYSIDIADLAGEPMRREFDLAANPIKPSAAFWLEFDFVVGTGTVLWDSLGRRS